MCWWKCGQNINVWQQTQTDQLLFNCSYLHALAPLVAIVPHLLSIHANVYYIQTNMLHEMSYVHFTRFTDVIGYDVEASKYHRCFRSRAAVLQQPRYQYSTKVSFLHFLHV